MDRKSFVKQAIEEKSALFAEVSDKIWEYAELSLQEFESAKLYEQVCADLGFTVESGICGIETAFSASFGHGRPVIGILAEYDALTGLSQVGGATEKTELKKGGNGHGCGHNMLGAGALAAAYGVKKYLEETGREGTVILYGTPGEEGGAAKAFMAKEGLWYSLDAALTWHPSDVNQVVTGSCNSCIQKLYKFHGIAAHAAGDPEDGRSALDAVELMNVGVNYLREHTKPDARIHYAMIDGGGFSPNVVQPTASVLYMIRSELSADAIALTERVDKIAQGAALMSGTTYETVFIDGCSNTLSNHTLERVAYDELCAEGAGTYTEEEWKYASAVHATCPEGRVPSIAAEKDKEAKEAVRALCEDGKRALNDFVAPLYTGYYFEAGSTDVGDVSWQTPTLQLNTVCFVAAAPGHSWQNVSCGKTSIGHKGLLRAAKVLASTAVDLFEDAGILERAKEEFKRESASGYFCPIPKEEKPKIVEI